jgi:hypothetical protein
MSSKLRMKLVTCAFLCLTGTALAASPNEQRMTTVHASVCKTDSPDLVVLKAGVGNDSTSTAMVLACPMAVSMRSSSSVLAGDGNVSCSLFDPNRRPWVNVYDRNTTADVSCTLFRMSAGNVVQASFTVTSTGFSSGIQTLVWNLPLGETITGQQLFVSCTVPPKQAATGTSFIAGFGLQICESDL